VPDYQAKVGEFALGQIVAPFGVGPDNGGTVVAVFPSLGMVDVEFPHGTERYPVEDLQRYEGGHVAPTEVESTPSGPTANAKTALYWAAKDRQYRATRGETEAGGYTCPKCKEGQLRSCNYKRQEGVPSRLLGCPNCMFLIKPADIIGHNAYDDGSAAKAPFANRRVRGGYTAGGKRVRLTWR